MTVMLHMEPELRRMNLNENISSGSVLPIMFLSQLQKIQMQMKWRIVCIKVSWGFSAQVFLSFFLVDVCEDSHAVLCLV